MTNVILCGGSGSRLWPLSRKKRPKQFFPLIQGKSLFEENLARNFDLCEHSLIVSGIDQISLARSQLKSMGIEQCKELLEPTGRNTAPAVTLACMALDANDLVLVTPSDHFIKDVKAYHRAIKEGVKKAEQGYLVTFGIKPTHPDVSFGYIETDGNSVFGFKEKPDLHTANKYFESGRFLWNSGIYLFRASVFMEQVKILAPEVYKTCKEAFSDLKILDSMTLNLQSMERIPSISIDCAVMEKTKKLAVVPCDIGWYDMGTVESLVEFFEKDASFNTSPLPLKPYYRNSSNNFVATENEKKIVIVDVQGLVIIDTEDILLIKKIDSKININDIIEDIECSGQQC